MQAAHASVLQNNTTALHATSITALLDKGQQACRQPCIALSSEQFDVLLSKHACKQHVQVSCNTAQACCSALAPLLCLTRASMFAGRHVKPYRSRSQVNRSDGLLSQHVCKRHMQVSRSTAQMCCMALASLLCWTTALRFASSSV